MTPKRIHHLKTWPEPWHATECGDKLFEFRRDDRGFAVGDELRLKLWDPSANAMVGAYLERNGDVVPVGYEHRAATLRMEVTYVLRAFGVPEGYVVMGLVALPDARETDQ